ncbi:hypothetical protein FAM22021_001143 [Propionibacterium freudenreichii]|nr:hypothetical protein [Propionibacterium freudenreichii]
MMANTPSTTILSRARDQCPDWECCPPLFRFDAGEVVRTAQYHFDELAVDGYETSTTRAFSHGGRRRTPS